jgi:hypothetical protein
MTRPSPVSSNFMAAELVTLAPSRQASRPIAPGDYVATLTLSSR